MTKHCTCCTAAIQAATDYEAIAASECAENVILDHEIRRLRAALQTSNDKLAEALAINAKQAQHIRALHGEGAKA